MNRPMRPGTRLSADNDMIRNILREEIVLRIDALNHLTGERKGGTDSGGVSRKAESRIYLLTAVRDSATSEDLGTSAISTFLLTIGDE